MTLINIHFTVAHALCLLWELSCDRPNYRPDVNQNGGI